MPGSPAFPKLRTGGDASRTQDNVAGQVGPVARAVAASPMLDGVLPPWEQLDIVAASGFLNNSITTLAYNLDPFRRVQLRGALGNAAGCAASTLITTLPMGARPLLELFVPVVGTAGAAQALWVQPDGSIRVLLAVAAGGTVAINGSFLADG